MLETPWSPSDPPLPEYPRPQLTRDAWLNLNGWWEYAIVPREQARVEAYEGRIRVPYPVESALSGVQRPLLPEERLWYRRVFELPSGWLEGGQRVLLHFGAVDWQAEVFVNGQRAGVHEGGYLPFTFDITGLLRAGENELVVAVYDPTDAGLQERGKQVLNPGFIWYTAVSGIWQTVWLEAVPETSVAGLRMTPDLDAGTLTLEVELRGLARGVRLEALALDSEVEVASGWGPAELPLTLTLTEPRPWSPADPHLYDLRVRLVRDGERLDEVGSYFALRKFSLERDARGYLRFHLNNRPLFLYGSLDQGYYPDGLYTPPSEEALLFDIEYAKGIGCNVIRKHIKVEPARWYAACDRLGMIVWQDMPNGGKPIGMITNLLALLAGLNYRDDRRMGRFGRGEEANRACFRRDLQGMVDHLYNVPSIAIWGPFNEGWGQFRAQEVAAWLKAYDPTRLVDHASGWFDQGGGDLQSRHVYLRKLFRPRLDRERAWVISEFGGYGLQVPGHVWDEEKKFSQRNFRDAEALTQGYVELLERLRALIEGGLAAAIYTQTTDVEIEINGYLTYDRKVEKMDAEILRGAHEALYQTFARVMG